MVSCAFIMAASAYETSKIKLKEKLRALKTDENEIIPLRIAATLFCFVLLCLFLTTRGLPKRYLKMEKNGPTR